jgi:hypothetical protein
LAPGLSRQRAAEPLHFVPRGKVLLVHEDPGGLDYYRAILQGQRFKVRTCGCFAEGAAGGSKFFSVIGVAKNFRPWRRQA